MILHRGSAQFAMNSAADGMSVVGIIANPAAGKDIRRLVAQGRVVSNQEKANTVRRVLAGLRAMGVELALLMPDRSGIAYAVARDWDSSSSMRCETLEYEPTGFQIDSVRSAAMMRELGAVCIVTVGGDGTNRVVSKGAGDIPLAPVSTGTNNVFPRLIEGTLAGLAAGAVATDSKAREESCRRACRLDVAVNGAQRDVALVDAAVSRQSMVGSRAIWNASDLSRVWLTAALPNAIGISSIGGRLREVGMFEPRGLHIEFAAEDDSDDSRGDVKSVRAPIAPGMIAEVRVAGWSEMRAGETIEFEAPGCTVALDGEREIELLRGSSASVTLNANGPLVVDFDIALRHAARRMSA